MFNIPTQRLAKVTVTEVTSAVTLSVNPIVIAALSFTPRHLLVRVSARTDRDADTDTLLLELNGDTGTNYNWQAVYGKVAEKIALRRSDRADWQIGAVSAATATAGVFSGGDILLPDALSTRTHKSLLALSGAAEEIVINVAGRWASTAAVTSVTFKASTGDYVSGSTFELCVVDESFNIDEQILGSDGTFTVSSIAAADGDLVCIGNLRTDRSGAGDAVVHNINDDGTSGNYAGQALYGDNTSAGAYNSTLNIANITGNTATTSAFGAMVGQFSNFADGANDPSYNFLTGYHAASDNAFVANYSTRRNNVEAITKLEFSPESGTNFIIGSMLSTYAVPKNLIERQELGGTATDVTFSSIPQTYDHLELTMYARSDRGVTMDNMHHNINGDTTAANYDEQGLNGVATTVTAYQVAADLFIAKMPGASETANQFGATNVTFYNYTKTDRHKHYLNIAGNVADNNDRLDIQSKRWESTAAITTIKVYPSEGDNFIAGSVFTLRGIHAAPAAASDVAALNGIAPADIEAVN